MFNLNARINIGTVLLWFLFFCAVFLRTFNLQNQGLMHYDEGTMVSRAMDLKDFATHSQSVTNLKPDYVDSKIFWLILIALGEGLLKMGVASAQFVSAFFGVLTIFLTYRLSKQFYDQKSIAILSVFFLTFSSLHVFYSRSALAESASIFLSLYSFYLFFSNEKKQNFVYFLSGLVLGGAFLTNRFRVILVLVYVFILACYLKRNKILLKQYCIFLTGFFGLVFSYSGFIPLLNSYGFNLDPLFSNLVANVKWHSEFVFEPFSLLTFFYYIFRFEGIGFFLLLILSPFFTRARYSTYPFYLFVLIQILFSSLIDEKALRSLSVVLPYMAIVCSVTLFNIVCFLKNTHFRKTYMLLMFFVLALGSLGVFDVYGFKSNIPQAVNYIQKTEGYHGGILSTNKAVTKAYARNTPIAQLDARLLSYYEDGFQYMIVDPGWYLLANYTGWWKWDANRELFPAIFRQCKPIKVYSHFNKNFLDYFLFEHTRPSFKKMLKLSQLLEEESGRLYIFEVGSCLEKVIANEKIRFYDLR